MEENLIEAAKDLRCSKGLPSSTTKLNTQPESKPRLIRNLLLDLKTVAHRPYQVNLTYVEQFYQKERGKENFQIIPKDLQLCFSRWW